MLKAIKNIFVVLSMAFSAMLPVSCVMDTPKPEPEGGGTVRLRFMVAVSVPASPDGKTRSGGENPEGYPYDFETAATVYEGIHTLRVIVVDSKFKVEGNVCWKFPDHIPQPEDLYGELTFNVKGGEKKRIYLIANEEYITPTKDFEAYTRGTALNAQEAEEMLQYNEWPSTPIDNLQALPYIDNTGDDKQYLPMTEFFDVDVLKAPDTEEVYEQSETLFITRNAVKFGFTISSEKETPADSYRIASITFNNLMQKSYLFPNRTVYVPAKYTDENNPCRVITSFATPGMQGNLVRPYTFVPENFGVNGTNFSTAYTDSYVPEVYFSETQNNTEGNRFSMDVEVIFDGESANNRVVYKDVTMPNLPSFPRNTFVKVNFIMKDHDLKAQVDVVPYIGVVLNPIFGFNQIKPTGPED